MGGNKGAVGIAVSVFGRPLSFLSSHFAAHQGAVEKRNADYEHIVQSMSFAGAAPAQSAAANGEQSLAQPAGPPAETRAYAADADAERYAGRPILCRPWLRLWRWLCNGLPV